MTWRSPAKQPLHSQLAYAAVVPPLLMLALAGLLLMPGASLRLRAINAGLLLLAGAITAIFTAWRLAYVSRSYAQAMENAEQQAQASRESERRFRAVFEQAAVAIAVMAADGHLARFNSKLSDMTGFSREELKQKVLADILHPADRHNTLATIQSLLAGQATGASLGNRYATLWMDNIFLESRCIRRDGATIWVALSISVVRSSAGEPQCLIVVMEDITARKQAEQERSELMLREQKARAEAEAANRRKDQFVAMMSHELRTPLTPVVAKLEMYRRDANVPPEMAADLEMIRRNVEMETRLIDDLLDLSTLSQGRMRLSFETVDVHEQINNALDIHRQEIDARHQRLTLDLKARRHFARADAIRLQQVFWNIIGNAAKYTHDGGSIVIRTRDQVGSRQLAVGSCDSASNRQLPTANSMLLVEVSDTGIGIEPEMMARLFNPFEQGEQSLIRRYGGVGLGLSVSKMLVEMHGGTLTAASAGKGRGATFTVELPSIAPQAAAAPAAPPAKAAHALRILLVEDNPDTLRVFARLLRSSGHEVKTASSVHAALESASHDDFDLLISDIGLPDGSGWELMREMRTRSPLRGIAVSGFTVEEDVRKSREAGFLEHLAKPINPQELEAAIARATV